MKTKLIKTFVGAAALTGLATTMPAITIGDPPITYTVDFGTVSYVSDLSLGGLRRYGEWHFKGTGPGSGASITIDPLNITGKTNLSFDWEVEDTSDLGDFSYYLIENLVTGTDTGQIRFHNGSGNESGTVSREIDSGDYKLQIVSAVAGDPDDYQLRVTNLHLRPVPDSSLGFLGIATIFAVIGAHRRFLKKATA